MDDDDNDDVDNDDDGYCGREHQVEGVESQGDGKVAQHCGEKVQDHPTLICIGGGLSCTSMSGNYT